MKRLRVCAQWHTAWEEPFDVFVCEPDSSMAIRELVLPCAIAKQHNAAAIQKDLLYFAIWVQQLLHQTLC